MLNDLFNEIQELRSLSFQKNAKPWPRRNPIASDISPCTRETVLSVLHWEERPVFPERLLARFEVGHDREQMLDSKALKLGIKLVDLQTSFDLRDRQGRVIVSGKIDGRVLFQGERVPFDFKTCDNHAFEKIHTIDDVKNHRFYAKWVRQLLLYMYGFNAEVGFLWLESLAGEWKFIEVTFDYTYVERILQQCEKSAEVIDRVHRGTNEEDALPPYHFDQSICRRCWALHRVCFPPRIPVEGEALTVDDDPELEQLITWRQELHASHLQFEQADTQLKKRFKDRPNTIVGQWLVKGEAGERHYKATEAKTISTWNLSYQPLELAPLPVDEMNDEVR